MIKCDNGIIDINGSKEEVLADLATIVHALHYNLFIDKDKMSADESRETITVSVELGFMSFDEAKKKAIDNVKNEIFNILNDLKELLSRKDEK